MANPTYITCDSCELLSINGTACHEHGCPNARAQWDGEQWIGVRECFECGCDVAEGEPCCE
jgi:hypothetical protein